MESKKAKKRAKLLAEFRTVNIGDVCMLEECCREVRLGATPLTLHEKLDGWNTLSDQYEVWEVVHIDKEDQDRSIVKRIQ